MFNWQKQEAKLTTYKVIYTATSDNEHSVKNGKENQSKATY